MAGRFALSVFLMLALGGCASSLTTPTSTITVAPPESVAEADAALAQATRERTALEAEYARSEAVCYTRFFVNNCLDEARETRRLGLVRVKAVEAVMERYKRQVAVDARDRNLAKAEAEFQAEEARRAAEPVPKREVEPEPAAPRPPARTIAERRAARDERVQAAAADAAQRGPQAASSAAARRADYAQRQRDAAAKKAERAERNARQAAERAQDAAAAAQPAATTK